MRYSIRIRYWATENGFGSQAHPEILGICTHLMLIPLRMVSSRTSCHKMEVDIPICIRLSHQDAVSCLDHFSESLQVLKIST